MKNVLTLLITCGKCQKQFIVNHEKLIITSSGDIIINVQCPECTEQIQIGV